MTYDISEAMVCDLVNEAKRMIREDLITEEQVGILASAMKSIAFSNKSITSRYYCMHRAIESAKNM